MTDTRNIRVNGETFTMENRYTAGAPMTDVEAAALNAIVAENIANNLRTKLKDSAAKGEDESVRQAMFAEYASEYVLSVGRRGPAMASLTPVEKEALVLARGALHAKIKEAGHKLKEWREANPERYEALLAEFSEHDKIVAQARKNVKAKEALDIGEVDIAA